MKTAEVEVGGLIDGRYRVIRQLGAGGMARVLLARDEQLGRDVAVKVFPPSVADDSDDAHRRRDEVTLLAGLSHPGLVVLFDASLDTEPAYLTMEHVEGETLAERLRRGPLPTFEATSLVMAIAEALAFVHARGSIHRDIKPGNILLPSSTTGTGAPAKLADFGIARLVDSSRVTATGSVMGTAAYISPEQASGLPASPASDIYALGIVLMECLTATHPFPGTALESASARLTRQPELSDTRLDAHRELLSRMTALDPTARPTAAEVVVDLSGVATTRLMAPIDAPTEQFAPTDAATVPFSTPLVADPTPERRPRSPRPARRRIPTKRWIAIAGAVLLAVCLVIGIAVASALLIPAAVAPRTSGDPVVTYPAVAGDLGIHLAQLQDAVAGTDLEDEVLAATMAASDGDYESASRLLDAVSALAAQALNSGEIDA
ncbi:MAG TPA: serine/threonine-protein kinase, partial [Pseudolysinimonas sp.]